MLALWKKSYDKPRQRIRKQRHNFADKGPSSQSYGCSSSHVWMWELDHKESGVKKKLMLLNCGVGELLRVPWIARRSNQSILKEITSEYSLEGLRLKPQYLGHLMGRTDSFRKDSDAGKDWREEENGTTENKMFRWHHQLNGHEFEQAPGFGDRQGSLPCCSPWGCK